ncbi:molybdenum cofactor sulfurase, putative [Trichomonas vaginalis G3]|uniref:Molybdenum cofactor sulfurase, putative n=1 Tax=Trichomonas vaginalis (strain ATCC PRA-98 / G3) TaxID=412133 RepID=A2EBN1_TRIV3|nr:molybdenum cofactor sulfurtransferase protein [Trichomonas vaginalis G3]EAY09948.1 molybdenum cofactor sulfurase, putative [Trichomonas vaginalis G3]KAI5523089.1 molybdenum cofactor sulfurtransferase protein [Trichomonas vaginalis G3]|eukprot:XP_001322171.1 molybdenum cofactor sulfurase [Trichomonas vaginalis G3]
MSENSDSFNWIKKVNIGLLFLFIAVLVNIFITSPKSLPSLKSTNVLDRTNYPQYLPTYRKKFMPHLKNNTYLDYTGAGVYPDILIERFREKMTSYFPYNYHTDKNTTQADDIVNYARNELLKFLGTDSEHYSVIFLASATQALKLVGENFPWTNKSKFYYTRFNHNSVLGIRRYAIAHGAEFNATRNFQSLLNIAKNMSKPGPIIHLLAMPLEDNFAGTKPTHEIMHEITHINGSFAILADAAAYLPTNPLNLTEYPFHAVDMSFYKIFGFPNYGALVIRNDFMNQLKKSYFSANSADKEDGDQYKIKKFPEGLEDDYAIPENAFALIEGIRFLSGIGMENIQKHVATLTKRLYDGLAGLNARIYGNHHLEDDSQQGGIVAFNLIRHDGQPYGYSSVVESASQEYFHLRGGCHCNPGACFNATGLRESVVKSYFDKKTTCGDKYDVINNVPLGAVRASLGWASTEEDVDKFINYISETYIL